MEAALGKYGVSYGYSVGERSAEDVKALRDLLDQYRHKEYKETPLLDNIDAITKIVAKNYEGDQFKAALLLIYDVCIRREINQVERSQYFAVGLSSGSNFRSGLDCMHFLFDLVNQVAGYADKYYREMKVHIDHEGLVQKYREEKKKYEVGTGMKLQDSELLGDRYPHALMVIESFHELMNMSGGKY